MRTFAVRTLGAFSLTCDGRAVPSPAGGKPRSLLAYLMVHRGRAIARDVLAEAFWPGAPGDSGRGSLKTALWSIRRALRAGGCDADAVVSADAGTVAWTAETVLDADLLLAAAKNGNRAGLDLYRGPFLEGFYEEWVLVERERIEHAYETLLASLLCDADGADFARDLLERDPFNENAYRALIRRDLAVRAVFAARVTYRKALRTFAEAGLEPDPSFTAEFAQLAAVLAIDAGDYNGEPSSCPMCAAPSLAAAASLSRTPKHSR
jgi:DNA-binding SARP family transcriptional activator